MFTYLAQIAVGPSWRLMAKSPYGNTEFCNKLYLFNRTDGWCQMNQNRDSRTGKFLPVDATTKVLQRAEQASQLADAAIAAAAAGNPQAAGLVRRAARAIRAVLPALDAVVQPYPRAGEKSGGGTKCTRTRLERVQQ